MPDDRRTCSYGNIDATFDDPESGTHYSTAVRSERLMKADAVNFLRKVSASRAFAQAALMAAKRVWTMMGAQMTAGIIQPVHGEIGSTTITQVRMTPAT